MLFIVIPSKAGIQVFATSWHLTPALDRITGRPGRPESAQYEKQCCVPPIPDYSMPISLRNSVTSFFRTFGARKIA